MEEITDAWGELSTVEMNFEELFTDYIIEQLDEGLTDYVTCIDIVDGKLVLELNSCRIREEFTFRKRQSEQEQKELINEYWSSRGV